MSDFFKQEKLTASDALKISDDFRIGLLKEHFDKIENHIREAAKKGGYCIRRNAPEHIILDIEAEFVSRGFNVELVIEEYYTPRRPSKISPSDHNMSFKIMWSDCEPEDQK